jgi:ABC-2 type transport system permease protein
MRPINLIPEEDRPGGQRPLRTGPLAYVIVGVLAVAVIGLAFVLRAAGDANTNDGSSVLTWISPIGWAENLRPFAADGERWWVLLLFALAMLIQGGAAYALAGRRDVGMSFLPTRPGPAEGRIATAGALAWRLQRGGAIGWALGFLLTGILFGSMTNGAADLVGDSDQAREIFQRMGGQDGISDAFLAAMVGMFGLVAAVYAVACVLRPHGEETSGRAEPVLANAVGRVRWAAGHLVIAYAGTVVILLLSGLGMAIGYGRELWPLLGAALVQVPAVWTLAGVVLLIYGLAPRAATAGWGVVGSCLALGWIGPALNLPQSVMDVSPFGHLPKLPGVETHWTPVVVLLFIAAAVTAAGLAALRRRDLSL